MRKNPTNKCCDCKKQISKKSYRRCRSCDNKTRAIPTHERFFKYVRKTDTCWIWEGQRGHGYGSFQIPENGRWHPVRAHRFSYELHKGEIPKGLFVLHHCDNPPCVNPSHLWIGSSEDNMQDMIKKGRGRFPGNRTPKKLTKKDVLSIRKEYVKGKRQSLWKKYDVSQTTIYAIAHKRIWKHIS